MNEFFLFYILIGAVAAVGAWLFRIEMRLRNFFKGAKGADLERVIASMDEKIKKLEKEGDDIKKYLGKAEERIKRSVKKAEVLRFNPFEDSGSDQSFAVSFLNEEGDGVVISSLYSRENVRIYAKPVLKGRSNYQLSREEKEVVDKTLAGNDK